MAYYSKGETMNPTPEALEPRFFIDHMMIHDRVTGRHVTTEQDEETWVGMTITETCALLNELSCHIPPPQMVEGLVEAARDLLSEKVDFYTTRNGRRMSIVDDEGEKCWIVTTDAVVALEAALSAPEAAPQPPAPRGEAHGQLDRLFIAGGEYVRADEAARQIMALQAQVDALSGGEADEGSGDAEPCFDCGGPPHGLVCPEYEETPPTGVSVTVEEIAREIYEVMAWAANAKGEPEPWVERGNSFAQDEARRAAKAILARLATPEPSAVQGDVGEAIKEWLEIDGLTSPPCTAEMLKASDQRLFAAIRAAKATLR